MALEQVADDVWVERGPLRFLGVHLGTRMTVVRLGGGDLFVHSPLEATSARIDAVDALGTVRHIVAPNLYHHLFVGGWASAYPEAKVHGAAGLAKKRKDVTFHAELGTTADPGWQGQLEQIPFRGSMLGEVVFYHPRSKTLISSDLVEHFNGSDRWFTRSYLKLNGLYQKPGIARVLRPLFRDRRQCRDSVERILEWDFERVVLAHGDALISTDARAVVREAYAWL